MKSTFIIELETKPRKFTERDFVPEQKYVFDGEDNLTEDVDKAFHNSFEQFLDAALTEDEDIEEKVIEYSDWRDEMPISNFSDLGNVQIRLIRKKTEVRNG